MKWVYTRLLSDEELRSHLEKGDCVAFKGLGRDWEEIERQVERLGFGDAYAVARTKKAGAAGEEGYVRVSPLRMQPEG